VSSSERMVRVETGKRKKKLADRDVAGTRLADTRSRPVSIPRSGEMRFPARRSNVGPDRWLGTGHSTRPSGKSSLLHLQRTSGKSKLARSNGAGCA